MKKTLLITVLIGASFSAFAQSQDKTQIRILKKQSAVAPSFEQSLRTTKPNEKLNGLNFQKEINNLKVDQTKASMHDNLLKSARGSEGVGGGNGVLSSDGKLTPLEVLFMQENKPIKGMNSIREKFPEGFQYFRAQIDKISKAIPSFAKDIESTFNTLQWTVTNLEKYFELNGQGCLNSTGVFKVRSGNKQIVIACQRPGGEIILSENAVEVFKRMGKPEYLGVVFLHETFVRRMLTEFSNNYQDTEERMIMKVMPYILGNQSLNAKELYDYTGDVGFRSLTDTYNPYALEAFEDRKFSITEVQVKLAQLETEKRALDTELREFYAMYTVNGNCSSIDAEAYSKRYHELLPKVIRLNMTSKQFHSSIISSDLLFIRSIFEPADHLNTELEDTERGLKWNEEKYFNQCLGVRP